MQVNIIVAYDENRVVGNKGQIPWRLPEDMAHFKEITSGCPVIMGRKTFESLPRKFRPLPDRTNIVITRNPNYDPGKGVFIAISLNEAITLSYGYCNDEHNIWIIGGGQIYAEALKHDDVDHVYASEVAGKHEGDTFFPELDTAVWSPTTLKHLNGFQIIRWTRNKIK